MMTTVEPLTIYKIQIDPDWGGSTPSITLTQNDLVSISLQQTSFICENVVNPAYFPVAVGQANAGECSFTYLYSAGSVYRTNLATVYASQDDGATWSIVGIYRVDASSQNAMEGTSTVHGFDKMADAESTTAYSFVTHGLVSHNPIDIDLITAICSFYNFTKDASVYNNIVNGYRINDSFTGVRSREMLAQIAAAYGGAFFVKGETLHFIDLTVPGASITVPVESLQPDELTRPVDEIHVIAGSATYTAAPSGSSSASIMEVSIPWGTQEIANALLTKYNGFTYRGFDAENAIIPLSTKLGDAVSIGSITAAVYSIEVEAQPIFAAHISAPSSNQ